MYFFVPEKGHPYPALAMTGIVTLFKNLAKFGIIQHFQLTHNHIEVDKLVLESDFVVDFFLPSVARNCPMTRKLRIEYPGAFFHIIVGELSAGYLS